MEANISIAALTQYMLFEYVFKIIFYAYIYARCDSPNMSRLDLAGEFKFVDKKERKKTKKMNHLQVLIALCFSFIKQLTKYFDKQLVSFFL